MLVHSDPDRERTEPIGVRLPVSLVRLVEAVQARDRDPFRNDTIRKAVEHYVSVRLAEAA
jgi:metal-responsive CopG/Arc/MetJ family transcriptional regulator